MKKLQSGALFVALMLGFGPWSFAVAGGLQVRSTQITMKEGQRGSAFHLGNDSDEAVSAQITIKKWTQDGVDRLDDTTDVSVGPVLVHLLPGEDKTIRLVRNTPVTEGRDAMYRILVQQLPSAKPTPGKISILMNYSIPLYLLGRNTTEGALDCWKQRNDLMCRNSGGRAIRMGRTSIENGALLDSGLFGYVLPGSTRLWADALKNTGTSGVTLISSIDGRDVSVHVAAGK